MRIFGLLVIMFSFLQAPAQVQSSAYNLTLKTLLSHSVPEVSVSQVKGMKNVLLLDAREWNEYQVSHIENAKYVGYDQFDSGMLMSIDKKQRIVVYCSVGYRSEKISEKLKQAGFTNVSNLYGGIFEWVNRGYPIVNLQNATTMDIHGFDFVWGKMLKKGNIVY